MREKILDLNNKNNQRDSRLTVDYATTSNGVGNAIGLFVCCCRICHNSDWIFIQDLHSQPINRSRLYCQIKLIYQFNILAANEIKEVICQQKA